MRKFKIKIEESKNKKVKVNDLKDIPPHSAGEVELNFTNDFLETPSPEELEEREVSEKWRQFLSSLSVRQKSILKQMLGLDKEKFSLDQIGRIMAAVKGK